MMGTFNTGSLTQTDPRVTVNQVSGVPDSKTIFSLAVIDNSLATTIATQNEWQDITLNAANVSIPGTELFTLINPLNGEFRNDSLSDATFPINGFVSAELTGGPGQFVQFVPAINGAEQSASIAPAGAELQNNGLLAVPLAGIVNLSPGDTIKLQIRNVGGEVAVIVTELEI